MIEVTLPDGTVFEVDTDDEKVAQEAVRKFLSTQKPEASKPLVEAPEWLPEPVREASRVMSGLTDQIAQGASLGLTEEAAAAGAGTAALGKSIVQDIGEGRVPSVKSAIGAFREKYDRALSEERDRLQAFAEEFPVLSTGAQIAGGIMGAKPGGQITRGVDSILKTGAKASAVGGTSGAAYGFGTGEGQEDRLERAKTGAAIGATIGGSAGIAGGALARELQKRGSFAPTLGELRDEADKAYKAASAKGDQIAQSEIANLSEKIKATIQADPNVGYHPRLHPGVKVAFDELEETASRSPSLMELDLLRRVMRTASKSGDPDAGRISGIMIDELDDFIANIKGSENLTKARDLWKRYRQGELISDLVDAAKLRAANYSGSGYENALRREFTKLAANKKRMRLFPQNVQKAIRRVVKGGPVANVTRALGKLAPRGVFSITVPASAGYYFGGWPAVAAIVGAGEGGRQAARALTSRNAALAGALARTGGDFAPPQLGPTSRTLLGIGKSPAPTIGLLDHPLFQNSKN